MATPGAVFEPVSTLPRNGWWQLGQWKIAGQVISEKHGNFYYPTVNDLNVAGTFSLDAHNGAVGDFNGDGRSDMVITWAVFPHTVERQTYLLPTVLLNVGGALQLQPDSALPATLTRHFPYRVMTGNFNGDGKDDFVYAGAGVTVRTPGAGLVTRAEPAGVAVSTGAGAFRDASAGLAGQTLTGPSAAATFMHDASVGDVNGDGLDDIFAGGVLWATTGAGTWADITASIKGKAWPGSPMSSAMGDLNGDGRADIVALYQDFSSSRMVLMNEGGTTPSFRKIDLPTGLFGANTKDNYVIVADVNRDGVQDIVVAETQSNPYYQSSALQILIQTAPGVFQDQTASRIDNSARKSVHGEGRLTFEDANGDGHPDLIHTNSDAKDGVAIFLNDGAGHFTLVDNKLIPFIQVPNLQGWEGVTGTQAAFTADRGYPIHINDDGIIDFVVQMQRPFTAWPQVEPSEEALYTLVSNPQAFGRGASERLAGSALADRIYGLGGNDTISAGGGNDVINGGEGDDALDGGNGIDTAAYTGKRAEFTIARTESGFSVTGKAQGEGADTLVNVERLQFADAKVALDIDGNGGMAYRLYQAAFNRTPDQGGLGYQMKALDGGLNIAQVAANFIASPEFAVTYGALDNTAFVNQLYQNVLHRAADSGGLAFHTGNLASGANTRANVLVGFSESPENQAALIGTIRDGMAYTV